MIKRISAEKRVKEGESIPHGYMVAYWDYRTLSAVCFPVPLALVVKVSRAFYYRIIQGLWRTRYERDIEEAYIVGMRKGAEYRGKDMEKRIDKMLSPYVLNKSARRAVIADILNMMKGAG